MANKMLIDATHPEETRVVVVKGERVEEFDFESANRKQLRGNIYLAKVTRVEPSLQAAFVDYGGNRHGFLAFSEIHPDYYQIPVADRLALAEQEAEDERIEAEAENAAIEQEEDAKHKKSAKRTSRRRKSASKAADQVEEDVVVSEEVTPEVTEGTEISEGNAEGADVEISDETQPSDDKSEKPSGKTSASGGDSETLAGAESVAEDDSSIDVQEVVEEDEDKTVDSIGAEDALEEVPVRPRKRARRYKIQEVIKRNQVLLIQVVKEERGNKGAALTTYMSIAGRYCVLMPNTARGGGISRKITNAADRKRLRKIASDLDLPEGMGVILRTAGASRTKAEIKRDFEYLLRLWETVRDMTLESIAPTLVYEEGSLVKRSIRDLYSKDIDEILVAGEPAYKEAKSFMRMLMPTHAKNVQEYKESVPIFARFNVENQLSAMFSPQVRLKSGGYIVINQTEALVAIDVNSGKSTREHNIEATAVATNLEAATEVARQFRLRDLAGLLVIDFIDMEDKRNNRAVERKLKECLKNDRARIQVGRISHFGLLEMSRQRLRSGILEGSTDACRHCEGTGVIRSTESVALHILRTIEEALMKGHPSDLRVSTNTSAALYILNSKRSHLQEIEREFGVNIAIEADAGLIGIDHVIERSSSTSQPTPARARAKSGADDEAQSETRGRRRSRRGGRGKTTSTQPSSNETEEMTATDASEDSAVQNGNGEDEKPGNDGERKRGRRRGRRGGRGRRPSSDRVATPEQEEGKESPESSSSSGMDAPHPAADVESSKPEAKAKVEEADVKALEEDTGDSGKNGDPSDKPKKRPARRRAPRKKSPETATSSGEETEEEKPAKAPARRRRSNKASDTAPEQAKTDSDVSEKKVARASASEAPKIVEEASVSNPESENSEPPRRGWWRRAMS